MITHIHHMQLRVPAAKEQEAIHFYENALGLTRLPKPAKLQKNGGAWFTVGGTQEIHVSLEEIDASRSKRHLCFLVDDLDEARAKLVQHNVPIIEDKQPIEEWVRFYVQDPGGNRLELAQMKG